MPVFADALPMPSDLPLNPIDPTSLSSIWMMWSISTTSWIIYWLIIVFTIVCMWMIFKKAWRKWRESIIPVWNTYVTYKIAWKKNRFWFLLIPAVIYWAVLLSWISWTISTILLLASWILSFVWVILYIIVLFKLAKKFGKSWWFGVWLLFLTPIFLWILAFGKAKYQWE